MNKKVFIVTGEHSGDIHASYVIKELKKLDPDIKISGIGGNEMKKEGAFLLHDHSHMAVVGLDSLKKIPEHIKLGSNILKYLKKEFNADLILLIDYGGFNLRLAKELKKQNYKVFYYIAPQVWVSRKGRLKKIKAYIDKVLLTLPFEEKLHKEAGVNAEFVGHPLMSQLPPPITKPDLCDKYKLDKNRPVVGIFPGSRKIEIKLLLDILIKTAFIMQDKQPEIQFCLAQSSNISDEYFKTFFKKADPEKKLNLKILKNANYELLSAADMLLLASGTVTLEAAIYQRPMIITYKSYWIAYAIYLLIRYIDKAGLPNIILDKYAIPEFIQPKAKPSDMAEMGLKLLNDTPERAKIFKDLADVNKALTNKIASARVAEAIYNQINDQ